MVRRPRPAAVWIVVAVLGLGLFGAWWRRLPPLPRLSAADAAVAKQYAGRGQDMPFLQAYSPVHVYEHKHVVSLGRALSPQQVLPRYFKYREALLVPVRTQGSCASCWAFAVADVVANRVSIHTRGQVRNALSAQELLSCFRPRTFTCDAGGLPEAAFQYVVTRGLLTEKAYPYENVEGGPIQQCKTGSELGFWELMVEAKDPLRHERNPDRIFAQEGSFRDLCYAPLTQAIIDRNIQNMKTEILLNGPVVGTVMVYSDLYDYDGESVYEVSPGARYIGGHAIEIFGWSDEGQNTEEAGFEGAYWIARTSWGTVWPRHLPEQHSGIFYIRMGVNMAGVESRASAAEPMLTREMKDMGSSSTWTSTAYSSYDEYVADPERQNFFAHLSRRRQSR